MAQVEERLTEAPAKYKMKIEDLYTIARDEPLTPKLSTPVSTMREEIKSMYLGEYSRGMDQLLETTWYTDRGLECLLQDEQKCQAFGGMLELFENTKANDYEKFLKMPQIEARVTWMLLCLPRAVQEQGHSMLGKVIPDLPQLAETCRRLSLVERLMLNEIPSIDPLDAEAYPQPSIDPSLTRQREFWSELGRFVTLSPSDHVANETCLAKLRQLLDQRENRDVLYSMAIARYLGKAPRLVRDTDGSTRSQSEPRLVVAKKFIEDEASSKGTTQVVQRICGMAARSWGALR